MKTTALFINAAAAIYMCGVIWVIQLIHYPSFLNISADKFAQFHSQHTAAMGLIVGPIMVLELITAAWVLHTEQNISQLLNLIIVVTLWGLTFFVSVPLHNRLAAGYNAEFIQKLINTNWPRTILWTARTILSGLLVFRQFRT